MASTNAKYYGENGIHRVPLWRIAGFAANNLATNMYLFLMGYVAYYLTGFVGVAVVTASSFSMAMRGLGWCHGSIYWIFCRQDKW